ncbi:MAG TPA: ATP-binding protein [Actinokineospora sp.]|jgi:AAA+ ATPase superfamily predicted ATPase|nr:ATP-binding protein [Actinokineospora sp.]
MYTKPSAVFDRDWEWEGLARFAVGGRSAATLGIVSGRRRQGKSFLLEALAEQAGGIYFAATEGSESESLRMFGSAVAAFTGVVPEPFRDWGDAITAMFSAVRDRPVPVVIDEFPFLSKVSPGLPSIIQRELGPGGSGQESTARLLLCGSAMSVMGKLLSGQAPLRGRAALELVVQPFGYRSASRFWGIRDPRLAVQLHAVVGGTPAYRGDFVDEDAPRDLDDFDSWVVRTVLSPRMPLFREARYLLAEESDIRDPALYHAVLAAIAAGNTANGQIAGYIGRKADQLAHPLAVLEDCGLVAREPDLFRSNRYRYRIAEPLITFYEAIMRKRWSELERRRAERVWADSRRTFTSKVVGPHFEQLCREFAADVDEDFFGGSPSEVGAGVVNDPGNRTQIEIDVVVLAPPGDGPRGVLSLGEVKWGETMGVGHIARLTRARDLLAAKGWDTSSTRLACYSGVGFTDELRAAAAADERILLIDLDQIYAPE